MRSDRSSPITWSVGAFLFTIAPGLASCSTAPLQTQRDVGEQEIQILVAAATHALSGLETLDPVVIDGRVLEFRLPYSLTWLPAQDHVRGRVANGLDATLLIPEGATCDQACRLADGEVVVGLGNPQVAGDRARVVVEATYRSEPGSPWPFYSKIMDLALRRGDDGKWRVVREEMVIAT